MSEAKGDTLSSKRGAINLDENGKEMFAYHEKDVKKFIKNLKENLPDTCGQHRVIRIINKLAGEDFI